MNTITANDFRIEDVRTAIVNGRKVKLFKAYWRGRNAHYFAGEFSAPSRTPKRDLWKVAAKTLGA